MRARVPRWSYLIALAFVALTTISASADPLARLFGGPFTLTAHDGRTVSDTDLHGQFALIFFGYTHCPDICPTDLSAMTSGIESAGKAGDNVQPVFITVDPARDTPEVLAQYRKSFHPRLLALTGSEEDIARTAKAFRVHRRKYLTPGGDEKTDYGVDHGSLMYLMGPDGNFKTMIPHGTPPERIAELIQKYAGATKPPDTQ